MGLLAGLLMFGMMQMLCAILPTQSRWGAVLAQTPKFKLLSQSLFAGLIGGVTHIFLDSLMHDDMNPFWPFVDGNLLAGSVSVAALHIALVASGFFGLIFWILARGS